jgi:hypothetical protein
LAIRPLPTVIARLAMSVETTETSRREGCALLRRLRPLKPELGRLWPLP